MKLSADAVVPFPREEVFRAYRDELVELVPHLPNVDSVEVRERVEGHEGDPKKTRLCNVWKGRASIPAIARGVLRPDMLSWDDHAVWDEATYTCAWRSVPHFFRDRTRCEGTTRLLEVPGGTKLEIRGELHLALSDLPGLPRLVVGPATRAAEGVIVALLAPNLASISRGLEGHLRQKQEAAAGAAPPAAPAARR